MDVDYVHIMKMDLLKFSFMLDCLKLDKLKESNEELMNRTNELDKSMDKLKKYKRKLTKITKPYK